MEKEADYGKKCLELFAKQDLTMCLSKTARSFSGKASAPYYKTFPKQGMMRNGTVYKQGTLIYRTKEKDCSLYVTPHASDSLIVLSNPINYKKILSKKISGQTALSMPIKRFNAESDYRSVRMYNGFSKELDTNRITALGNAVIPSIAQYLFECIKEHHILTQEVLHK